MVSMPSLNHSGVRMKSLKKCWQKSGIHIASQLQILHTFMDVLSQCGQQLKNWGANTFCLLPRRISILQSKISQLNSG